MLTPEGKISRYIFGATFDARELRDALVAAREGESTSTLSKLFLICYHYNPITGKYGATDHVDRAHRRSCHATGGHRICRLDGRARSPSAPNFYETSSSPDGPAVRPYQ